MRMFSGFKSLCTSAAGGLVGHSLVLDPRTKMQVLLLASI